MKNKDNNFDGKLEENPFKKIIIPKISNKSKKDYKNIFLCPLDKHDAVNSLDILDDIVIYGTIMGSMYMCRIDNTNLIPKQKKLNKTAQNFEEINQEKNKNDESSKISCIKLDTNNNKSSNNNNKIKNLYNEDNNIHTARSEYNKIHNHEINTKRILLKNIIQNKNNPSENSLINQNSLVSHTNNSEFSKDIKPLSQINQLITNANENIPCLSFDTKDKINVAVGDYEIFRFENLTNFSFNNENEKYYYTQIKNYQSENEHIRYCEGAICLIYNNTYLKLDAPLNDFCSPINLNNYTYTNKNLVTFEVIKGEIEMYNYLVPFDFDGDRFLFLDYESDIIRRICIFYTKTKIDPIIYKINNDYGHISFMKFISNNKIIICKKNKICEICDINNNLTQVETFEHIGEEIITMNVYIKGTKEEDDEDEDTLNDVSFKENNNKEKIEYYETNYKKNKKSKTKNKLGFNENIYGLSAKLHLKKFPFEKDKVNNSTYRELVNLNLKKHININEAKDNEISIYNNKNKFPLEKDNNITNELNNKKNIELISNNNEYIQSNKEFFDKNKFISFKQLKNGPTERCIDDDVYILTVDKNGNFNKYHNGKIKTVFNLYEIKNIEQNYKDEEFFNLGFPYFVVMNNKYYAISTDHGVFVLSNKK